MKLRVTAVILTYITLAAHFSRADILPLSILALLIPFLLLIKKRWSLITIQVLTYCGALEWLRSTVILVQQRMAMDMPWTRLAVILVIVALFTGLSALVFQSRSLKDRYSTPAPGSEV